MTDKKTITVSLEVWERLRIKCIETRSTMNEYIKILLDKEYSK
jgi:macrodomain Ter protein organizer (MatP/YcbG family)